MAKVQATQRKSSTELGQHLSRMIGAPRTGNKQTYEQIGKAVGVSAATISMWANGKRHPEREHLRNLCCVCKASFDDVTTAFELAGYHLTRREIQQHQSWLDSDLSSPSLLNYQELEPWLDALRAIKAGKELEFGLTYAEKLVAKIKETIEKEGAKAHLLALYFDALEEATEFHRMVNSREELKKAEKHLLFEMDKVCEDTKDPLLQVRYHAVQGDEKYIIGSYWSSYRTLKAITMPSLLASIDPYIQIGNIYGGICLDLGYRNIGSTEDFEDATLQLEGVLDRYAGKIDLMWSVHGYERLCRAYARRYQHRKKPDYKKKALQVLADAETLTKHEIGYPVFGLRVPRAQLELADCGVIEDLSVDDMASLAKAIREKSLIIGDKRLFSQMDSRLKKLGRG
jgi:transcriptional regulator with XRE-family HTH domain